jgi:predicted GIY-YIG superfamily endonuclease
MKYVYFLQSIDHRDQTYVGLTDDLRARLVVHNSGGSPHTSKYKPWQLVTMSDFLTKQRPWRLNGT